MIRIFAVFFFSSLLVSCKHKTNKQMPPQPIIPAKVAVVAPDSSVNIQQDTVPIRIDTIVKTKKKAPATSLFSKAYITGKFNFTEHPDFVKVDDRHASRSGMYLRKEVYEAFVHMHDAAKKEGITLTIRSATRNFYTQKRIWEDKWTGKRNLSNGENLAKSDKSPVQKARSILLFSSMPGTSRHHWGTEVDLNHLANSYFKEGVGYDMYVWMKAHAHEYGFCQVYSPKGEQRPSGYEEERWHWSYLPTASQLLSQAKKVLKDDDISGFLGSETASDIQVVQHYVLGIAPECMGK